MLTRHDIMVGGSSAGPLLGRSQPGQGRGALQPYSPSPFPAPLPCVTWDWTGVTCRGDPTPGPPFLLWISTEIVRSVRAGLCSLQPASCAASQS